jgi:hypothetical protein
MDFQASGEQASVVIKITQMWQLMWQSSVSLEDDLW